MQSIQFKTHVGADGVLQVSMPPEVKEMDLEVMVIFQPTVQDEEKPRYNAWRKPLTRQSIQGTIEQMRQLQQEVSLDRQSILAMREEGRRF